MIYHWRTFSSTTFCCHLCCFRSQRCQMVSFHSIQTNLALSSDWARATLIWWTLHFRCMEWGTWCTTKAEAWRWVQIRKANRRSYVLVWSNASRTIWECIRLASISILWKSVQVCTCLPRIWCVPSCCIHPNGKSQNLFDNHQQPDHSLFFNSFHLLSLVSSLNSRRRRTTVTSLCIANKSWFMECGRFYLMMNFLTHIVMALWSNVLTESCADCFHAFLHTPRIIQKSMFRFRYS